MPVVVDRHLREQIPHEAAAFPVSFFEGELADLPGRAGPLHWHPDFELAQARCAPLEYRVGQHRIRLEAGDCLFVNGNQLHSVRQLAGDAPDPLPIVVFSGTAVAPATGTLYRRYIAPVAGCASLPFAVFRRQDPGSGEVLALAQSLFDSLRGRPACYEMAVQRDLNRLLAFLFCHLDTLPRFPPTAFQLRTQVRVQKMLDYIARHYREPITAADIAGAASISRSEAGRCFKTYLGCSPVQALLRHRLQVARGLLQDRTLTVEEISAACGFSDASYFTRQFRKTYGMPPRQLRNLGK